jgi:uncharacterized membrane protein YjgN (DUF898 family)
MADTGLDAAGRPAPPWVDTIPWQPSGLEPAGAREAHRHRLDFSGWGRQSFRIGTVQLLATALRLGLFYPWAMLRRLRCFPRGTRLGGQPFGG